MQGLPSNHDLVRFPIQGTGTQTRSFVFIDDLIDGLMAMLRCGTHLNIYNIGTQEEVTIAELARMIGDFFGKRIEVVPALRRQVALAADVPILRKLQRWDTRREFLCARVWRLPRSG